MDASSGSLRVVRISTKAKLASVEIDGRRLEDALGGFSISHAVGEYPQVILYAAPHAEADFEGLARVAVADAAQPGPAAAAFLEAIDPAELERAALSRLDLGTGPQSATQAMLTQLTEWARGL
ncbi:hypothetical protein [Streptomyces fractus]|uniref:hypothetical protein n=1 Tax=Streptomyces fractus TaxID=641806 RepID=UPI003CEC93D8